MATLAQTPRAPTVGDERFFLRGAIVMTLVIIAGFSLQLAMGRSTFASPLRVHAHAIVFMGWVGIYLLHLRCDAPHGSAPATWLDCGGLDGAHGRARQHSNRRNGANGPRTVLLPTTAFPGLRSDCSVHLCRSHDGGDPAATADGVASTAAFLRHDDFARAGIRATATAAVSAALGLGSRLRDRNPVPLCRGLGRHSAQWPRSSRLAVGQ